MISMDGKAPFTVLLADRNRHVSEFLRRELEAEGFRVRIAKDGEKLLTMIRLSPPPDIVILDPDIPYSGSVPIIDQLEDLIPPIPLVIHTFLAEFDRRPSMGPLSVIVEKKGNIDFLKDTIKRLLRERYPERFQQDQGLHQGGGERRSPSA
jgi:DNA-binding response OmpR family regulator